MTTSIQQLRTQAEQGIAADVQTANNALQQIAQINGQLAGGSQTDSAAATLEDQRDQDVTQLAQLMNVRVVQNPGDQISVFTGTGLQLVSSVQASQLAFNNVGTLSATSLWSANPSQDNAGTITLTSPGGSQHRSDRQRRHPVGRDRRLICRCATASCRRRRTSSMNWPIRCRRRLSNQTTSGTPAGSGPQTGFSVDVGGVLPGNSVQLTYTDSGNTQHTITIVSLGQGGSLPLQTSPSNPNDQIIGVDFSGGLGSVVTQLNAAFGSNLQFSKPSAGTLQVVNANASGNVVNSLSATATVTSLTSGNPQLPLFLDGTQPITGALTSGGSQTTGLAGRITVNGALVASPGDLVAYAANTSAGDPTRPNFILNQMTSANLTYSPTTGIGTAQAPFSGTLANYMSQIASQQSQAANAATNLQQGQDAVVTALQQRFNQQSGVSIDTEMSNLIALQNAYGANARVMTTIQQMMAALLQMVS